NAYRLYFIRENGVWKIQKAIADDFTGIAFHPDIIANPEAFRAYSMDRFEEDIDRVSLEDVCKAAANTKKEVEKDTAYFNANKEQIRLNAEEAEKRVVQEKNAELQASSSET
ncbi:MAG: hypothetical protein Q4G11_07215, partial [Gallicola sp.]|nr:hypothetical protein [Gallicola sp.]